MAVKSANIQDFLGYLVLGGDHLGIRREIALGSDHIHQLL
jgi:hypothetical protein